MRAYAAAALALGALVLLHVDMLRDAYGDGAPYYGQTTNMDKWTSPWPTLGSIDALSAAALGTWAASHRRRGARRAS